jgi:predicted permease
VKAMRKFWRQLYFLINRRNAERDLAEEMATHREMMPLERREDFGHDGRLQEQSRDAWSWAWLEQIRQDLGYGARVLLRSPGFTLGAIAVLALGVGVNMAEFQVFDALIFHRLTFRDADVALQLSRLTHEGRRLGLPAAAVEFYRSQNRSFEWILGEGTGLDLTVESESVRANFISADYFTSIGVVPAYGRLIDARDAEPGAPLVAALSYAYWQTHWAADPQIVGRIVRINNRSVQIAGILPADFTGLSARNTAVWVPISARPNLISGSPSPGEDFSLPNFFLFGKLKPGVSLPAGAAELTALTRELSQRQPRFFNADDRMEGVHIQDTLSRSITRSPAIGVFIVMIFLVLISACANLGNMLVARGLSRQREISIRIAIGAGRARIVRQLVTESFLLALLGAAAGLAVGSFAAHLLMTALNAPPDIHLGLRWPAFLAGFALVILSTIAFGLPSALQTVNANRPKKRLRQGLIGLQVAVSCLLLIASGVLVHNGIKMSAIDIVFDYQNMIVVDPQFYVANLPPAVIRRKLDALTQRLAALPGVDQVTAVKSPPLGNRPSLDNLPGLPLIYRNAVAPSYFTAMTLPFVRGQTFLPGEQNAAIVSESAARAIWPSQDPVGKRWTFAGADRTVVGVVKDSRANLIVDTESIEAYIPLEGRELPGATLILHSRTDPAVLLRMIHSAGDSVNQTVLASLVRTSRDNYVQGVQKLATLIGSIGAVASALAAAGMFALVAFAVAQRRREFGIRMAIGARSWHILKLLLSQNSKPVMIGSIVGVALAAALTRVVRAEIRLPTHDTVDPAGFALGLGCFLVIAILAALSPALRALKIDPSATLREE